MDRKEAGLTSEQWEKIYKHKDQDPAYFKAKKPYVASSKTNQVWAYGPDGKTFEIFPDD